MNGTLSKILIGFFGTVLISILTFMGTTIRIVEARSADEDKAIMSYVVKEDKRIENSIVQNQLEAIKLLSLIQQSQAVMQKDIEHIKKGA